MQEQLARHHQHVRKRLYKNLEMYPADNKLRHALDIAVYCASFFGLVMTLPQLWNIWIVRNASGVSALSWIAYSLSAIIWLMYGIVHKEKPIIYSNTFAVVFNILIVIGTLMYG